MRRMACGKTPKRTIEWGFILGMVRSPQATGFTVYFVTGNAPYEAITV